MLSRYLNRSFALASLSSLVVCSSAQAEALEWQGFLTTGTAFSDSKTPYNRGISRKARLTEETYLGLNLSKTITKEWRVAAQILARGDEADTAAKVDWAFVTYAPNDEYDVTLGKQKIPMWMISDYIDVGRLYPWVIPPPEVYGLFNLKSFTGGSARYRLQFGESTLSFEPYAGDVVLESAPNAPTQHSKIRGHGMFGLSAQWEIKDFLVRAAYNRARWNLNLGPDIQYGERDYQMYTAGVKADLNEVFFMAEYAVTDDLSEDSYFAQADRLQAEATTAPAAESGALLGRAYLLRQRIGGSNAYYATLGRSLGESFLAHVTYANSKRPASPELSRDQSSVAVGLNYDIGTDAVIKSEVKHVMIPNGSRGLFDEIPVRDEARIYRFSYSMVF